MKSESTYVVGTTDYYGEYQAVMKQSAVGKSFHEFTKEDTIPIKSGDKLIVRWPDGKFTTETIRVRDYRSSAKVDMFAPPDQFTARVLEVVRNIHGQDVFIPLKKGQKVRLSRS